MPIEEIIVILHDNFLIMNKIHFAAIIAALLFTGCANEFNKVYTTNNVPYKYEYAKECFAKGKWTRTTTLLTDLIVVLKGTENAQESLYMLAMAQYNSKDYEGAAATFKRYYSSYPKGDFAENAEFYIGQSPKPAPSSASLNCRTNWFAKNCITPSFIMTSVHISEIAVLVRTTTRLALLRRKTH